MHSHITSHIPLGVNSQALRRLVSNRHSKCQSVSKDSYGLLVVAYPGGVLNTCRLLNGEVNHCL